MRSSARSLLAALCAAALAACTTPAGPAGARPIEYVGSSTVALFLRDAEDAGAARFRIDTTPESRGGLAAVLDGTADFAGFADRLPEGQVWPPDVAATLFGRDAIAVIVHPSNPVRGLGLEELRAIYTGEVTSWRELGGPDLEIRRLVVGRESATRRVFEAEVLAGSEGAPSEVVRPDAAIVDAVASSPGAIGHISLSFLRAGSGVRALAVGGEAAETSNLDYPLKRPLYLLWREGRPDLERFVAWALSAEGQRVVMRRFVGERVVGSFQSAGPSPGTGVLVVVTQTFPVYDGGIYYYPHLPYEVFDRDGELVRRVRNHRSDNDEEPTRVQLPAGTYWVRAERTSGSERREFYVTIEVGEETVVDLTRLGEGR